MLPLWFLDCVVHPSRILRGSFADPSRNHRGGHVRLRRLYVDYTVSVRYLNVGSRK